MSKNITILKNSLFQFSTIVSKKCMTSGCSNTVDINWMYCKSCRDSMSVLKKISLNKALSIQVKSNKKIIAHK